MKILAMEKKISEFLQHLRREEYAENSIISYNKDLMDLFAFARGNLDYNCKLEKEFLIEYKKILTETVKPSSVNRKIAAINKFLDFLKLETYKLKSLKIQEHTMTVNTLTENEFKRLIEAALQLRKRKIALIMLTLASVGIRISELQYITAEAVKIGKTTIRNKGQIRTIIIPTNLREKLTTYCRMHKIENGVIFLGNVGQPISRSYISREMKTVAGSCCVDESKAFPHNLRHYFARKFLDCGNELSDLADILGHVSVNTTRRYLWVSEEILRKQMEKTKIIKFSHAADFFALWAE